MLEKLLGERRRVTLAEGFGEARHHGLGHLPHHPSQGYKCQNPIHLFRDTAPMRATRLQRHRCGTPPPPKHRRRRNKLRPVTQTAVRVGHRTIQECGRGPRGSTRCRRALEEGDLDSRDLVAEAHVPLGAFNRLGKHPPASECRVRCCLQGDSMVAAGLGGTARDTRALAGRSAQTRDDLVPEGLSGGAGVARLERGRRGLHRGVHRHHQGHAPLHIQTRRLVCA